MCQRSSNHKLKAIHNYLSARSVRIFGVSKIVKSQIESNSQLLIVLCFRLRQVCQRSSNHKLKAIHNGLQFTQAQTDGVSKIVKSQIESNSQLDNCASFGQQWCVKDRQITNWKQFTTDRRGTNYPYAVCQRSSNHKLKAIHNRGATCYVLSFGVSKIVKSQIESNSQRASPTRLSMMWCVKDRQITNWKQFTTPLRKVYGWCWVCQRSSNHKLKAIHNPRKTLAHFLKGVSKIVKSQIESNSQQTALEVINYWRCVKDRQITNWKQFTTSPVGLMYSPLVCQRSSNHKLKAIHNHSLSMVQPLPGVSKIVKSQIESNSQPWEQI